MSAHIAASDGDIAPVVLLPGDPLRARRIAETFLEDTYCYSEVRGMPMAIEMETSALYTLARHGRRALAVCAVSDHIVTGEQTTAQEREQTVGTMVEVALEAALED